jgi:excisionase family DNA binding protein
MGELLTIEEASAYLKVPVETLRKWRTQDRGPKVAKIGRHLRYRAEELKRWVREQERATVA